MDIEALNQLAIENRFLGTHDNKGMTLNKLTPAGASLARHVSRRRKRVYNAAAVASAC
jgi:hypothetical protein